MVELTIVDQASNEAISKMSVNNLELSTRAAGGINSAGFQTFGDLLQPTSLEKLLKQKGLGRKTLQEIQENLAKFGVQVFWVRPR